MHTQFPEHDAAISEWLAAHGWPVTIRHYDFNREVFAWRAAEARPPITLRVSQTVCEHVPPHTLTTFFDGAKLADKLTKAPDRYTIVMRDAATGGTVIAQLPNAL